MRKIILTRGAISNWEKNQTRGKGGGFIVGQKFCVSRKLPECVNDVVVRANVA